MHTVSELRKKIAGIRKSATTIRDNVQIVVIETAAHAYVHGDVSLFDELFDATSGLNRKSMAKWIHKYGFANLDAESGTFKLNKKMRRETDFADGDAVIAWLTENAPKWYEAEESAKDIAKELDVVQRLKSLTSQVKNAPSKNTVVKVDFAKLRDTVAELGEAIREVDAAQRAEDQDASDAREAQPTAPMAIAAE